MVNISSSLLFVSNQAMYPFFSFELTVIDQVEVNLINSRKESVKTIDIQFF